MRLTLTLFALAAAAAACTSPPPPAAADEVVVAESFRVPAPGALIVLLPARAEAELQRGASMMTEQLHRQLKAQGWRVALLDAANHEVLWRQEAAAAGGVFDPVSGERRPEAYATALGRLARRICEQHACELVLQQELVLRRARLEGQKASWDGQLRPVPVAASTGDGWRFSGQTPALSVALTGVRADGQLVFRSHGGAALPYRLHALKEENELRPDLFADDTEVADGVRLALRPLRGERR